MSEINNTFTCINCKKLFINEWSDKEAIKESKKIFPSCEKDDLVMVCDYCYKEIMQNIN